MIKGLIICWGIHRKLQVNVQQRLNIFKSKSRNRLNMTQCFSQWSVQDEITIRGNGVNTVQRSVNHPSSSSVPTVKHVSSAQHDEGVGDAGWTVCRETGGRTVVMCRTWWTHNSTEVVHWVPGPPAAGSAPHRLYRNRSSSLLWFNYNNKWRRRLDTFESVNMKFWVEEGVQRGASTFIAVFLQYFHYYPSTSEPSEPSGHSCDDTLETPLFFLSFAF